MKFAGLNAAAISLSLLAAACATTPRPTPLFTPEQEAVLRANRFVPTERGWEFSANDKLLFAFDDSKLKVDQIPVIQAIAGRLDAVAIMHATIEGHTDATGAAAYNDQLSLRRAGAVAEAFISGGFNRDGIKVEGLGSRYPIESNDTREGREENRRVVILITTP